MSFITITLYLATFGLWTVSIFHDRGIGIGGRFLFGMNLALFYLVGPLLNTLFLDPNVILRDDFIEPTTQLMLGGMLAYLLGAYWIGPSFIVKKTLPPPSYWAFMADGYLMETVRLTGWRLFWIGVGSITLRPIFSSLTTLNALWSVVNNLAEIGVLLLCLCSIGLHRRSLQFGAISLFALYSVIGAALGGHIGFQFFLILFFISVILLGNQFHWRQLAILAFVAVIAFYPYMQWISGRGQLRTAIIDGASLEQRIAIAIDIFTNPPRIETDNQQDDIAALYRKRGDYSQLLAAAMRHTPSQEPFAGGDTLIDAFYAIIPRVFWPNKTYSLGGSSFVTRFTGIRFSHSTSVAVGFPFEFYVNFGVEGVITGLFLLGIVVAYLEGLYYQSPSFKEWSSLAALMIMIIVGVRADTFALSAMGAILSIPIAWGTIWLIPETLRQDDSLPLRTPLRSNLHLKSR